MLRSDKGSSALVRGFIRRSLLLSLLLWASTSLGQTPDDNLQSVDPQANAPSYALMSDPAIEQEAARLLDDERYRFCHDEKYRLFQAEKDDLCPQLASFHGRCPALSGACSRPPWEADMTVEDDDWDLSWLDFDLQWLSALFKFLFWAAAAFGVILLARALLRQIKSWREESSLGVSATPVLAKSDDVEEFDEHRAHVLFAMARQKIDAGEATEALHLTYRAMVRTLSDIDWVKPHKSKTSGDYLRGLRTLSRTRSLPEGAAPRHTEDGPTEITRTPRASIADVTGHLLDLDRERFCALPRVEQAENLWGQSKDLAARLTNVAAMTLCLWFVGCERGRSLPQAPYEPHAPRGSQLFEDMLRSRAYSVNRRLHRVVDVPPETRVVVAINASLRPIEWVTLSKWVGNGGHLVVAGPPSEFSKEFGGEFAVAPCSAPLLAPDLKVVRTEEKFAFVTSPNGESLVRCGDRVHATSLPYDSGWLTVVADASLFENASLAAGDNASLAFHLVGDLDGHVEYLGPWTGRGAQDPLQSITRAGFGWWVLHLLLLGAFYAWSRGKRMGPPTDPRETARRAFTEHAQALSRRYEKAHASGWALQNYAEWVLESLRKRAPSTRADMKSLTRAVSTGEKEASKLREALTTARRAHELGESTKEHMATFRRLKSAIIGLSEVSRKKNTKKD